MTDDLVKRLRDVGRDYDFHENALVYSAADRIEALTAEVERLREKLAATYIDLSGHESHTSDCATSNAPAYEPGPCDCAALGEKQ